MAGGGGGEGNTWLYVLGGGTVLCVGGYAVELTHAAPEAVGAALLAIGGLGVVFGSCEAMIKSVEGIGQRLAWNQFVAGTIAGLVSNVPEIVMLAFVVLADPKIAFVVVALTLHVNALLFGVYSGLLPRTASGAARLPEPLVKISTDLYAAGAGLFVATGLLMVLIHLFHIGQPHTGEGFDAFDLYGLGFGLLFVQAVATTQLVRRFSGAEEPAVDLPAAAERAEDGVAAPAPEEADPPPSWGTIGFYAVLGIGTSLLGGHAVGDFADTLVEALEHAGYSQMIGAIILAIFAGAGAYVMIVTAHLRGLYDIALASVSGSITQVPFLVLPSVMLLMALFGQLGWVPVAETGAILPLDLETTAVILLAFPPMLVLWKSIQDDGKVNWVETAGMVAVFALNVYFLARYG
jgi:Ca2+/Na+ antiporter